MAKSNRRRKLDRAKRQGKNSQKQLAARRRQAAEETAQYLDARFGRLFDPSVSVAELAILLDEQHEGDAVPTWLVKHMLASGSSLERLAEVAEAMLARDVEDGVPSLTALTFAAEVARVAGEGDRARDLLDQALAAGADDPEHRLGLLDHLRLGLRLADCVSLLEASLRDIPEDDRAAEDYGRGIQEAHKRVYHQQPSGRCRCGRGPSWQECCAPGERAALNRFTDRSSLTATSDAVAAFLVGSKYSGAVDDKVTDLVAGYDDLDLKPDELASFRALLAEHALLTVRLPADDLDGEAVSVLAAFIADSSVPRELAAEADTWRTYIHYGLWRIGGRSATPGLWCTDLCSGVVRYAEFPAPLTDGWPRWSVWLGALVPVDGIWRATGTGLRLSPAEGDAAAEFVADSYVSVLDAVAGKKKRSTRPDETMRVGHAEPIGVAVDWRTPMSSDEASVMGMVVGYLLARIVGEVYLDRWIPPAPRNAEGDEMCLITAEITVNDSERVADRLAARPGFERDPDDPARIVWYGIQIPEPQRKRMMADATAQLGSHGLANVGFDDPAEPQRSVRGTLRVGAGQIVAEVNSDKRLARLLDVLSKVGAAPVITDEKRMDPAQVFPWADAAATRPRGAMPSGEGWEEYWLDEHVTALGGRTPREAADAEGKAGLMLEAMLRQFEYEADVLGAKGQRGIDTDWLRKELGLADDESDGVPEGGDEAQALPD